MTVSLSGSLPSSSLVGSPVVWTATASGHGQSPVYQFGVGQLGSPAQVVRDFSPTNSFVWNPLQEGTYVIVVRVKDSFGASDGENAIATYTATTRVTGANAVISATANPLVALYSAPPSALGSMHVDFRPQGSNQPWSSTSEQPIVPGKSTNILVAGMLSNTTYVMRSVLNNGAISAEQTFRTGTIPTNLTFPGFEVQQGPGAGIDPTHNIVFHAGAQVQPNTVGTVATDLAGNVVWYYDPVANAFQNLALSVVPGGTILMIGGGPIAAGAADGLREVDLAGDTVRETSVPAVNAQLAARGLSPISHFSHDAQRLPNGDTVVLALTPRVVNLRGRRTTYVGDMVIVLDKGFQVKWAWDPFQHLDVRRLGTLGEGPGDWMHANSVAWSPADGNLIVSMRSQDWVIKLNYDNGSGDGRVLWKLGRGGNFRIKSRSPYPWFSHQHDVTYINDTTLILFDNGNTRHSRIRNAHSRGQVLVLDEKARTATLALNVDIGNFAMAVGSAQALPSGNFVFDSGFTEQTIQVTPNGTKVYIQKMNLVGVQYRSYMLASLDSPV